jgi:CRP-like cAMP-binding protein
MRQFCIASPGSKSGDMSMAIGDVHDRRMFTTDEIIFREGEVGRRCAYLIESGKVEISKKTEKGEQIVLGVIPAGGIFGEMALIDNKPRMAMAKAVEPTAVVLVSETMLESKLNKADPFVRGLLNLLVRNIRSMAETMAK